MSSNSPCAVCVQPCHLVFFVGKQAFSLVFTARSNPLLSLLWVAILPCLYCAKQSVTHTSLARQPPPYPPSQPSPSLPYPSLAHPHPYREHDRNSEHCSGTTVSLANQSPIINSSSKKNSNRHKAAFQMFLVSKVAFQSKKKKAIKKNPPYEPAPYLHVKDKLIHGIKCNNSSI